ncbi:hypothetical protein, partial [Escherichia coli]|uniref:hypothetical protein n=1 Tax=Escherichia coli TaxID=562 RepID=UPI00202345D8
AVIQEGCKTITADKTTGQYGPINADMTVLEQSVVSSLEVLTALWGAKQLNRAANERISQGFSDPVDTGTGEYLDYRTSLYIDLCNCLILICSIQHQMKVNLWTKKAAGNYL